MPRQGSVLGTSPAISLPRPAAWARDTEGLSCTHLCQECDSFVPHFGLNLIPWWLGHFGDYGSGPFAGTIKTEESRDTGAGRVV